jgi:arylsulfatase
VTYDYPATDKKFNGEVNWVEIDLGKDSVNLDHLITPEQRLHLALATQ